MPFGSKKGKTAASNNKQLCLGLPDILIAAVARHYGLQEREAAAGIDDDGGAAGEPARVNQHDAQATAARDAALLEAIQREFVRLDEDGSGKLSRAEVRRALLLAEAEPGEV